MSNIDNMLDETLDDLEDLPSFTPFAPGAHTCSSTMESKEIAGKPAIELMFTLIETQELVEDSGYTPPSAGDTCNTVFFMDNEIGRGKFKQIAGIYAEKLGIAGSLRDIIEAVTDVEVLLINKIRVDKNTDREYLDVQDLAVL